ncbi:MAG: SCP2 sterol-binding domain-containing protein [Zetaproteobacteria bacterium]|nr:SCP2 sterol-binding domain-containing protein [Zetaproteobacteria bacterium]
MSVMFLPLRLIPLPVQCVVMSTVLDLAFSREASLKEHLNGLNQKVFRIHVSDLDSIFYLGFKAGRTWVHPQYSGDIAVKITASTTGFSRMCFAHEDPDDLVFQQVLQLSGDSEAMLRFKKLLAAADLNWEDELRASFGEFFGSRVAKAAYALVKVESKLTSTSKETLQHYLNRIEAPNQQRLQTWQAGVEQIAHQNNRLKSKITRLEHRTEHLDKSQNT